MLEIRKFKCKKCGYEYTFPIDRPCPKCGHGAYDIELDKKEEKIKVK